MKIFALWIALLLAIAQPAHAWGKKGHAAIATIAEANLTPAARKTVASLLKNDLDSHGTPSGRRTLAEVASWADEIRKTEPDYTYRGWHTRGNPVCGNRLGNCRYGACVDQKLLHYKAVLQDRRASQRERNEALKWVVHLVGDLHTPLHAGSNRDRVGHIPATLEGRRLRWETTLHGLWDTQLVHVALKNAPVSAKLRGDEELPTDAVTRWMQETREVSRAHVYAPLPGFACGAPYPGPVILDRAYQQQSTPVIRLQITRAGLRLALLLNAALE